ncbi:SDR family NAD(P)-dependent oxidoreductase [Thalassoroseus pseudoceratinae]|uniref:SDR family NAD(P)-dependent oxidoreductase n=1 Tax=Thalassoroseus pseudoceratinae TaxID=2713176 RepID=UPI001420816B|nr:SDR family oxidoreductase [Thalassoroseus pseudoceratinae]
MKLTDQIAIVTGAGRGIGQGCAIELARNGADIVLNDRPGCPDLESTAEGIRELGRRCQVVEADVFSREGCEFLVAEAIRFASRIDILVSNPAFSRRGAFLDYPPELFEATINGTLTSGYHMSQLVARQMVNQNTAGKIVFISSVQAEIPTARCFAYGAAKAGLNHMARSIAVELAPHRINVNVIEPGWIDTPGEHVTFTDETIAAEGKKLPWKRLGLPEDIGKAAVFLASSDADYISGTVLPVDGLYLFNHCMADKLRPLKDDD